MPLDKENIEVQDVEEALAQEEVKEEDVAEESSEETSENTAEAEVEVLKKQLAESGERIKRLQADFENFRRRTRIEKDELSNLVVQEFMKDLLPLIDNFDRAMAAESTELSSFRQGMEMIYSQLGELLKNKGLEEIEAMGAKFDPNFHQAIMRIENPELEDDTIAMELQKGYMVKGKVIRPSMVQVVAN